VVRVDPNQGCCSGDRFGSASHFDASRVPGREHVVDDDRDSVVADEIPELFRRRQVAAADLDDAELVIKAPPGGHDVWRAVNTDGGDAGKTWLARCPE
jgi:hypothetical protein